MVNKNGFPLEADPRHAQSALARQAREELNSSQNPTHWPKPATCFRFKARFFAAWESSDLTLRH